MSEDVEMAITWAKGKEEKPDPNKIVIKGDKQATANEIVSAVQTLGQLLASIRDTELVTAFSHSNEEQYMERYLARRAKWRGLFQEIAKEMDGHCTSLGKIDHAMRGGIDRTIDFLTSKRCEDAFKNLERFVKLCKDLEEIQKSGLLGKVVDALK